MEYPPSPPTNPAVSASLEQQRLTDLQHLQLLSIFHYIYGGLSALGGCVGIFYLLIGIVMASQAGTIPDRGDPPPAFVGGFMIVLGGCLLLASLVIAGLVLYSGWSLSAQRNRTFCLVVAAVMCLSVPLGTVLGIFTIVVLVRPSVAALFAQKQAEMATTTL